MAPKVGERGVALKVGEKAASHLTPLRPFSLSLSLSLSSVSLSLSLISTNNEDDIGDLSF